MKVTIQNLFSDPHEVTIPDMYVPFRKPRRGRSNHNYLDCPPEVWWEKYGEAAFRNRGFYPSEELGSASLETICERIETALNSAPDSEWTWISYYAAAGRQGYLNAKGERRPGATLVYYAIESIAANPGSTYMRHRIGFRSSEAALLFKLSN